MTPRPSASEPELSTSSPAVLTSAVTGTTTAAGSSSTTTISPTPTAQSEHNNTGSAPEALPQQSQYDTRRPWSIPILPGRPVPFADPAYLLPSDRIHPPQQSYLPQPYQHSYWAAPDPRYPQRLEPEGQQHLSGPPPPPPPYPYPTRQQNVHFNDARAHFAGDQRYYAAGMASAQPYAIPTSNFDYPPPHRYRQPQYPYHVNVPYDQAQPPYASTQSPQRGQFTDASQSQARSPGMPSAPMSSGSFIAAGSPYSAMNRRALHSEPTPSYPRGPPRKPRQSGYAVWVGNLAPGTTIMQLKDYFSRGATDHIESVFLIAKSNCAFVNYKTAESAQAAVARFHDTRLNGARLVCRLRHAQPPSATGTSATADSITPTQKSVAATPADPSIRVDAGPERTDTAPKGDQAEVTPQGGTLTMQATRESLGPSNERVHEKYFVVKSLTMQDLEASVRDGIWATQAHNETALKEAFETAQHVYLIFSANKSGEYFGYARMKSNIDPNAVTSNPRADTSGSPTPNDGPIATPTPATEHAPKGRIIDDSARGTIFWEAEDATVPGSDAKDARTPSPEKSEAPAKEDEDASKQDWGKPFQIEWLSTTRLPFYRTRGLRNPWNANREVKIARDGTELEPGVGRKLLELFHQPGQTPGIPPVVACNVPTEPILAVGSGVDPRPSSGGNNDSNV